MHETSLQKRKVITKQKTKKFALKSRFLDASIFIQIKIGLFWKKNWFFVQNYQTQCVRIMNYKKKNDLMVSNIA